MARAIVKGMLEQGVLVPTTGDNGNTIRLTPALVINESRVDASLQALSIVLSLLDLQNRS